MAGLVLWAPILIVSVRPVAAIDFGKLVMPGEVIEGHSDVESECRQCHAPFQAGAQNGLCLVCHTDVDADLQSTRGFHGLSPGLAETPCKDCHTEHKGRDASIVELDPVGLDHDLTDHPLRGGHVRVPCEQCHAPQLRWREAPAQCVDCHGEEDPHGGRLGEDCASCHVEEAWAEARFDHDTTDFPLVGRHADVACSLCHAGERYAGTPNDCQACHQLNDAHLGRFGSGCESCHSPRDWKKLHFDHGRDTKFPLRGEHAKSDCSDCHTGILYQEALSMDCVSCHRSDDVHRGRNGDGCDRCHSEASWQAETFDHERMTKFPLRGAHATVKCQRCHTGTLGKEEVGTACHECHARDDVHEGQEGADCDACHTEKSWTADIFFEHDLAKFPLLGLHAVVACEQCHFTPRFRDAEMGCIDCHREEDVHYLRLGPKCALCHNPNGWSFWSFDHEEQTGFSLHGAHAELDCHSCHRAPAPEQAALSGSCGDCHGGDDPHFGAFGRSCGRCHDDASWSNVNLRR